MPDDEPRYCEEGCLRLLAAILSGELPAAGAGRRHRGEHRFRPFSHTERLDWLRGQLPRTLALIELGQLHVL